MRPLKNINKISTPLIIFTLMTLGSFAQTKAQTPAPSPKKALSSDTHTRIIQQSIALMEQSKWQQTLDLLNPLIQKNKTTGLKKHGAKFATAYYYKGLCLLKLAQQKTAKENKTATTLFQSAIQSLNQCYAINPPNDNTNTYRVKSLLLRGNAQQALEKYQLAIHSYKLFLHERNSALDPYSLSDFNINLAICHWKNPSKTPTDITKARKLLQQSLLYTGRNTPTPRAVITALRTLTDIAITTNDPALIPATIQHTRTTSPGNLILPADTPPQTLATLSKLIITTAQKNLPLASLHLTTLIPGIHAHATELEIPAIHTQKLTPNSPNQTTNQAIKNATAIALQSRALTLQKSSHLHKAIRLYTTILNNYPDTPHQQETLYNLTRLAAQAGATDTAITRASQFLKTYPDHKLTTPITTILLNTLYHTQQYRQALTLAEKILPTLATDTPETTDPSTPALLDAAAFIRAASHYYLGNFATAAPLLAHHHTTHPHSPYHTDTAYLTAAVQNQLLKFDTSIPALQAFITNHPNPPTPPSPTTT